VDAVDLLARYGDRLLGDYRFDPRTGLWRHRVGTRRPPLRLRDLTYAADGTLAHPARPREAGEEALAGYLDEARRLLTGRPEPVDEGPTGLAQDFEALRWFHLPPGCLDGEWPSPRPCGDTGASA
jgi:hypothetical protein